MPFTRPLSKSIKTVTTDESLCDDEEKPAVLCDDGLVCHCEEKLLFRRGNPVCFNRLSPRHGDRHRLAPFRCKNRCNILWPRTYARKALDRKNEKRRLKEASLSQRHLFPFCCALFKGCKLQPTQPTHTEKSLGFFKATALFAFQPFSQGKTSSAFA